MKKNIIKEPSGATLPVGKECKVASRSEAVQEFSKQGIYGNPVLFYIEDTKDENVHTVVWAVINKGNFEFIPAFTCGYAGYDYQDFYLQALPVGDVFQICGRFYIVTLDDNNQILIKDLRIAYTQEIAAACAACRGYLKFDRIDICKLFLISDNQRYLTTSWVGFSEAYMKNVFISMFMDDSPMFNRCQLKDINYVPLSPGETFEHDGILYQSKQMIRPAWNKKPQRQWFIQEFDQTRKPPLCNRKPRPKVQMQVTVNQSRNPELPRSVTPQKEP